MWCTRVDGVWNNKFVMMYPEDGMFNFDAKHPWRRPRLVDWNRHCCAVMHDEVGPNGHLIRAIVMSFLREHANVQEGMLDYDWFNCDVTNFMQMIIGASWFCGDAKFFYGKRDCDEFYLMNVEFLQTTVMRPKMPTHGVMIDDGRTAVLTFESGRMADIGWFGQKFADDTGMMDQEVMLDRHPQQVVQSSIDESTAQSSGDGTVVPPLILTTDGAPVMTEALIVIDSNTGQGTVIQDAFLAQFDQVILGLISALVQAPAFDTVPKEVDDAHPPSRPAPDPPSSKAIDADQ